MFGINFRPNSFCTLRLIPYGWALVVSCWSWGWLKPLLSLGWAGAHLLLHGLPMFDTLITPSTSSFFRAGCLHRHFPFNDFVSLVFGGFEFICKSWLKNGWNTNYYYRIWQTEKDTVCGNSRFFWFGCQYRLANMLTWQYADVAHVGVQS